MPSFKLEFHVKARKEWDKLDATIRLQFAKKLKERMTSPRIEADKLSGMADCSRSSSALLAIDLFIRSSMTNWS